MRIFLLGDSFTANIFQTEFEKIINNRIVPTDYDLNMFKYVNTFYQKENHPPLHFSDWLKDWGYDVYNFANGGASLDEIIHQFAKIPLEYKEGDRIILNLTHHSRFMWFLEENHYIQVIPGYHSPDENSDLIEFLQKQCINRDDNIREIGYLKEVYIKFIDYLIKKHSNYNPIVWGPFSDTNLYFEQNSYFFKVQNILIANFSSIYEETDKTINDKHFGAVANHILATAFDIFIKDDINSDYNNINSKIKIINKVNETKLSNTPNLSLRPLPLNII
jgi:hypothetical protein